MKPYVLIKGSDKDIASFEQKIADAIEEGYQLSADLVTQVINDAAGQPEIIFLQSLVYEEDIIEFEDDDAEDMDEVEFEDEAYLAEES